MNREFIVSALRENWYWFLALGLIPVAALAYTVSGPSLGEAQAVINVETPAAQQDLSRTTTAPTSPFKPQQTRRAKAEKAIAEYKCQLEGNPNGPDTANTLRRIGNLYYSALGDEEQAIHYYEMLAINYPEDEGLKQILPMLAASYERTGQRALEATTYQKMLETYSPGSEHYVYAQEKIDAGF